jgi:hypothetical protein
MESFEAYKLTLDKLYELIELANRCIWTKNYIGLDKIQDLVNQESRQLESLWNLSKEFAITQDRSFISKKKFEIC